MSTQSVQVVQVPTDFVQVKLEALGQRKPLQHSAFQSFLLLCPSCPSVFGSCKNKGNCLNNRQPRAFYMDFRFHLDNLDRVRKILEDRCAAMIPVVQVLAISLGQILHSLGHLDRFALRGAPDEC